MFETWLNKIKDPLQVTTIEVEPVIVVRKMTDAISFFELNTGANSRYLRLDITHTLQLRHLLQYNRLKFCGYQYKQFFHTEGKYDFINFSST